MNCLKYNAKWQLVGKKIDIMACAAKSKIWNM